MMLKRPFSTQGFTLIELSIVLVIIGLIVGGILVGQDLIRAAGVRATVTQIEKYNIAANTFFQKYGYLPGDIPAVPATQFGLAARGTNPGEGDGNGLLEGIDINGASNNFGFVYDGGELNVFWVDLSTVHLIDGSFSTASETVTVASITATSAPSLAAFFPVAKLGRGNYIYVWSGNTNIHAAGTNYYGISAVSNFGTSVAWPSMTSTPALTVKEAFDIDKKTDDGLPQSGNITATYISNVSPVGVLWAAGGGGVGAAMSTGPTTVATPGTSTTCYDNGNVGGSNEQYSVEISNGLNINCALSFKMQAGD